MLKGDEAALITAAVAGCSLAEIAAAAEVSVSTVQRRLRDDDIRAAVYDGRTQQRREAAGRLNEAVPLAIGRLVQFVADDDPRIALNAIGMLLGNAHKLAVVDYEERLSAVELRQRPGDLP